MKQKWFEILTGTIAVSSILIFLINGFVPALAGVASLLKIVDLVAVMVGLFVLVDADAFQRMIGVTEAPKAPAPRAAQQSSSQQSAPARSTPQAAPAPAKKFQPGQATASVSGPAPAPVAPAKAITKDDVEAACVACLDGLSDMDEIVHSFSHDLVDFMNQKPRRTKAVVLWGNASTGKTEFAHRLAGHRKAHQIPGLNLDGIEVHYVTGMEHKGSVRDIVDKVKPGSIVFIDEADKFFDPQAGMLTEQESKNIKSSLIMNFEITPIFWVFLGTFADRRAGGNLTAKMVQDVFGPELGSRLSFDGYSFKSWDLNRLFEALKQAPQLKNVEIDPKGFAALVQLTLKDGGGPRFFLKCVNDLVKRRSRKEIKDNNITSTEVEEYIAHVG